MTANDKLKIVFFLIIAGILFSFETIAQDKITLNHADSLIGKTINKEQVREAIGNVSMTHLNTSITCNRVVQYFDQNKAELFGNVRVIKDTMTITAPSGTYYGSEGKVICSNGATLNDSKVTLQANYGVYYFNQDMADFKGNVRIYDNKSYTITSDALQYFRVYSKSFAQGNVKIVTDSSVIFSDSLVYEKLVGISTANGNVKIESDSTIITSRKATYYDFDKKSIAEGKVKINFLNKNSILFGAYAENYEKTNYSFVRSKCRLIKIESNVEKNTNDTLYISSEKMEAFRNSPEHYIATDSVKIIRSDFSSLSQIGYYFKSDSSSGGVVTISKNPVVWKENFQISGDSIYAIFKDELEDIYVRKSAFALKTNTNYTGRYDQISGVFMYLKFLNNEINYIQVDTNASSIYFVFENSQPNGTNKSEGDIIILLFNDSSVDKVKIYGLLKGTFFPENQLNIDNMRLVGFRIRTEKPTRLDFFEGIF